MNQRTNKFLESKLPWLLFALITTLIATYWLHSIKWDISRISILNTFPILGIYAWSIMWTHYIIGANRIINPGIKRNRKYTLISGLLVITLIILHPSLLAWSQWSNLGLLPPTSFYKYVDSSMRLFILFGSVSLFLFLSYDVLVRLKDKPIIRNNWKWISASQMLAMTLIFIHGLALGDAIDSKLFEFYWIILGLSLIPCFGLIIKDEWIDGSKDQVI